MRKKELLIQNTQLFDKLTVYEMQIAKLKEELAQRDRLISNQKAEIERIKNENNPKPLKTLEEKVIKQATVSNNIDYGAAVIGKTVVSAAKYCNKLAAAEFQNAKELLNLILGRTEVAKAEILKIVSSEISSDEKKEKIDAEYEKANDYFESVMAQNNSDI